MDARTLRAGAATAAVPAVVVVIAHLAWAWRHHGGAGERQALAFDHGIALAVILALVLIAARLAMALERGGVHPIADAVAVAGVIGVMAHLAATWRDDGQDVTRVVTAVEHLLALAGVGLLCLLIRRAERRHAA